MSEKKNHHYLEFAYMYIYVRIIACWVMMAILRRCMPQREKKTKFTYSIIIIHKSVICTFFAIACCNFPCAESALGDRTRASSQN